VLIGTRLYFLKALAARASKDSGSYLIRGQAALKHLQR
jgi:hypothetical protein